MVTRMASPFYDIRREGASYNVDWLIFVGECRIARDDQQTRDTGEVRRQLFGDAINGVGIYTPKVVQGEYDQREPRRVG
jgi:hypothetical protein